MVVEIVGTCPVDTHRPRTMYVSKTQTGDLFIATRPPDSENGWSVVVSLAELKVAIEKLETKEAQEAE